MPKQIVILELSNGKSIYIDGNSFSEDEAHEVIILLTGTWGNDFEKQELCDLALEIHGESKRNA